MNKYFAIFLIVLLSVVSAASSVAPVFADHDDDDNNNYVCNQNTETVWGNDGDDEAVDVDFQSSDKKVVITVSSGYQLVSVSYDPKPNPVSYQSVAVENSPMTIDPAGNTEIENVKIVAKKVCVTPTATATPTVTNVPTNTPTPTTTNQENKITWCHVEPNGNQETLELPQAALQNAGHMDANGNPLHAGDHAGACVAATATPTPTTVVATATPTATPTPEVHEDCVECGQTDPTATPTVTEEPTVTPTDVPSNPGSQGGDGLSDGRSDGRSSGTVQGMVLSANTMASTGGFVNGLMNGSYVLGLIALAAGLVSRRKENKA